MTDSTKMEPHHANPTMHDPNSSMSSDVPRTEEEPPSYVHQHEDQTATDDSAPTGEVTATTDSESLGEQAPTKEESVLDPPLPPGPPPDEPQEIQDDGWQPVWDETYGAYYFYNSITRETTWTNPRVPEATDTTGIQNTPGISPDLQYNPAVHGDYDPTAPYAQSRETVEPAPGDEYTAVAKFNRFTGKFQAPDSKLVPENYNDENKSRRQMQFYFDVDAAANSHDGRSLKAERQTKKLSKKELKEFKAKRKEKKEQKRRAWLKD